MKEFLFGSPYFGILLCVGAYAFGEWLRRHFGWAILNPLLIAIVLIIGGLLLFDVDYADFESSSRWVSYLLTPATVCFAVPLYRQLSLLRANLAAVLAGIAAGVLSSLGSVWALCYLFGIDHVTYVSLLPKSVTSAIGMGLAEEMGGIPAITVASIIATGILGNLIASSLLRAFKITDPVAKGVAIGASSHAMGTSRALEMGEVEGAMSSLAVAVSGLMTVAVASFFATLL